MEARILEERLHEIFSLMKEIYEAEKVLIRQVANVLGIQNFITRVIPTGKAFKSRLIALTRGINGKNRKVTLSIKQKRI